MKLSVLSAGLLAAASVAAIETIEAVGNKFFTKSGKQFFIKGTARLPNPTVWGSDTDASPRDRLPISTSLVSSSCDFLMVPDQTV